MIALTLDDCKRRVSVRQTISSYEPDSTKEAVARILHDKMRHQVADRIAHDSVIKTEGTEYTTYSLEVYVHTAEELIALINRQALELSRRLSFEASLPR